MLVFFFKCLLKPTKLTSQPLINYDSQFKKHSIGKYFIELAIKAIQVCHDSLWNTPNELFGQPHSSFQSSISKQVSDWFGWWHSGNNSS